MTVLAAWALRHGVSPAAMADLAATLAPAVAAPHAPDGSLEAWASSAVRLEAPSKGVWLTRNNVGVLKDVNGRPVRYGLANESKAQNERMKSGDLIGVRPVVITAAHLGRTIGQLVSREIKRPGWTYNPRDPHEAAQMAWVVFVTSKGGDAAFATGPGSFEPLAPPPVAS